MFTYFKLTIPSSYQEDWDAMTPISNGRHCNSCTKSVIDFTEMQPEEIKSYLLLNAEITSAAESRKRI